MIVEDLDFGMPDRAWRRCRQFWISIGVRRLDISWIGGANQAENSGASAAPLRYGNGVQFYANMSDSYVEGCRIWGDLYDTAVTNQFSGTTG